MRGSDGYDACSKLIQSHEDPAMVMLGMAASMDRVRRLRLDKGGYPSLLVVPGDFLSAPDSELQVASVRCPISRADGFTLISMS